MGLVGRAKEFFLGRRRALLSRAKREEALGRLDEATALYLEAESQSDAARLFALRAEAATDAEKRIFLLGQAAAYAEPADKRSYEVRRARLTLELVRDKALELGRGEVSELALRLEKLGEPGLAAEAYALALDPEAEARMLVEAGAIERLERVLDQEQDRERDERRRHDLETRIRDLVVAGKRREAETLGRPAIAEAPRLGDLLREVEARRVSGPRARLELDGVSLDLLFGERVVIGRAGATLELASPAVSREHLMIRRASDGPEAVDLGSRNGTQLRGAKLDAPVRIGDGVELELGGEVAVSLGPWGDGGVRIQTGEDVVHAPLGVLEVGRLCITPASDGWLELEAREPACLDGLRVDGVVQLLSGDVVSEPGGRVRVKVLG